MFRSIAWLSMPWRLVVDATVIVLFLAAGAYAGVQVKKFSELEARVLAQDITLAELTNRVALVEQTHAASIAALEREVYGAPPPTSAQPPKVAALEAWQKNRDQAIRQRLDALERWRYRIER